MFIKYRSKPVEVEAVQFRDDNKQDVYNILKCKKKQIFAMDSSPALQLETIEGIMFVNIEDWIIKDSKGLYRVVKAGNFENTYDKM